MGFSIPGDISLIGFDGLGHQLFANLTITTIQQPIYELGRMLAETLLDKLAAAKNYATGAMSKDEAVAQFKADVANAYPELTIE